jgi:hypothetical protein
MHNPGNVDKNYPYPVLGNINDFEVSNLFELSIRYGARNNEYEFLCNLKFDSFRTDIEKLIEEKKVKYTIQVFNAQSWYRQYFESYEKEIRFNIAQNELRGMCYFTGNIISIEEINNYLPIGQNEKFYTKSSFDIFPGSVLGISNTIKKRFEPNFSNQDLINAKHIITFVKDEDIKTYFKVKEWNRDQIRVAIPKKIWDQWNNLAHGENRSLSHMSFYLPVLTEIIWRVESDDELNNQFKDRKWYHVVEQLIEDADLDENMDPHVKAQELMKGPLKPYIKRLDDLMQIYIQE